MIKRLLLFSLFLFASTIFAQNKKISVTIDDLPVAAGNKYSFERQKEIFEKLISTLKSQNIPIIGFVNENKLITDGILDERKVNFLKSWLNAGFDLGNHTYSHKSANEIHVNVFEEEILKGERVIRKLIEAKGKSLKYFRHPFLQTGRSLEIKNEIKKFLKEHRYQIAPVTIDNSGWIFASAYDKAIDSNKTVAANRIGKEYIEYMKHKLEYWESQSVALFERNINHILLIHANTLNADYYDKLCEMIRRSGYKFIPLDEALKDEAYKSKDTFTGAGGISWIYRWAVTQGKKKDFFGDEPMTPKYIMNYAGVDSE